MKRTDTTETAFAMIRKTVADLREERDLYRNGLESIVKRDPTEVDAKIIALLYLGRVEVRA